MNILLVFRSGPASSGADDQVLASLPVPTLPGVFEPDTSFAPVVLHAAASARLLAGSAEAGEASVAIARGAVSDAAAAFIPSLAALSGVIGVFSDPDVELNQVCLASPPVGTEADVANLLAASQLHAAGMDGAGVLLAVVDNGINLAYLAQRGRTPALDASRSSTMPGVTSRPGQHPLWHGTMSAYDTGIAAPRATLLDICALPPKTSSGPARHGRTSNIIRAYNQLLRMMLTPPNPPQRLVVGNIWGIADPTKDFPPGHPGNYTDNPLHPLNLIVSALEAAGADIVFGAGNCGRDCPSADCKFGNTLTIAGVDSLPDVLTVAAVDINKDRAGYSSQGPGRIAAQKPDLSVFSHFLGSEAKGRGDPDGGTSAAAAVASGVVAAVRSLYSTTALSPAQLRTLLQQTADDRGNPGFDSDYGWGVIDVPALIAALPPIPGANPPPVPGANPPAAPPWPGRSFKHPPLTVGPDVATWQQRMTELGFPLVVDGKYGGNSKAACVEFQKQHGLVVDGIVGPKTWVATWNAAPIGPAPLPSSPVG